MSVPIIQCATCKGDKRVRTHTFEDFLEHGTTKPCPDCIPLHAQTLCGAASPDTGTADA